MSSMKAIQNMYSRFGNILLLSTGTICSGATLMYIIDDCHKCQLTRVKQDYETEIEQLNKKIKTLQDKLTQLN